jgi:hypothetical protein
MVDRHNKRPGGVAKCLFLLIILAIAAFAWIAVRGLQKEPHGPVVGSDVLPGQAARANGGVPGAQPTS